MSPRAARKKGGTKLPPLRTLARQRTHTHSPPLHGSDPGARARVSTAGLRGGSGETEKKHARARAKAGGPHAVPHPVRACSAERGEPSRIRRSSRERWDGVGCDAVQWGAGLATARVERLPGRQTLVRRRMPHSLMTLSCNALAGTVQPPRATTTQQQQYKPWEKRAPPCTVYHARSTGAALKQCTTGEAVQAPPNNTRLASGRQPAAPHAHDAGVACMQGWPWNVHTRVERARHAAPSATIL